MTALAFDKVGEVGLEESTYFKLTQKQTDLILFDRMRGHKDQITSIRFLPKLLLGRKSKETTSSGYLLSSSKGTLLKLCDLSTQHCMESTVAHRSEVWDFDISKDEKMLMTGSNDLKFKVWTIDRDVLAKGLIQ